MRQLATAPNLVDQVRTAILEEIAGGRFAPGDRVLQDALAQALNVSRQPVQQALMLLRAQGILQDAPGRGLIVAALDPTYVQSMYDMRAVIEGLACQRAAASASPAMLRSGRALIETGRRAVATGSVPRMIDADIRFHAYLYALSGNHLIEPALAPHLAYTQRVMGEVLNLHPGQPQAIWDEHQAIFEAIEQEDGEAAERLAREHIARAGLFIADRLLRNPAPR
jgi:DNA-binding GntR family transcriptional regulator